MTFWDRLNPPKCDYTQNRSGGKIIKFQQSQALTLHFESFWSIVLFRFGALYTTSKETTNESNLCTYTHIPFWG